ncbi:DUF6538 domain-containing protein [Sphingomonas psychrolutea]
MSPNRDRGLWRRGSVFQCRVRVPRDLVGVLGTERINVVITQRSLFRVV